jgi:hypothetical protein
MKREKIMSNLDNVRSYMKEYGELRAIKKAAEVRLKELDEVIRPALEDKGAIVEEGYMFELKINKGRKGLDKAAVEAAGIDLEPYYKVGAPYTSLFVKELG